MTSHDDLVARASNLVVIVEAPSTPSTSTVVVVEATEVVHELVVAPADPGNAPALSRGGLHPNPRVARRGRANLCAVFCP